MSSPIRPVARQLIGAAALVLALVTSGDARANVDYQWLLTSPKGPATVGSSPTLADQPAASTINNAGMSSTSYPTDRHSTLPHEMFSTGPDPIAPFIEWDLGATHPVGKMLIWNYNAYVPGWGSFSGRGMRNCTITYSHDASIPREQWSKLIGPGPNGTFTLAQASSANVPGPATNQHGGQPVDFRGAPARYIRITPNAIDGNWGGFAAEPNKYYGLAAVRIYRHASAVSAGSFIASRVVSQSSEWSPGSFNASTTNYNMSDAGSGTYGTGATVGTTVAALTQPDDPAPYVIYDLGGTYPIRDMAIWNLNMVYGGPWNTSGLKEVSIYYTVRERGYNAPSFEGWTKLATRTLNPAGSAPNQALTDLVGFNNALARYVMIVPTPGKNVGNWGGGFYGLSQVRFYAGSGFVVEPAPHWNALVGQRSTVSNVYTSGDGGYSISYTTSTGSSRSLMIFDDPSYTTWNPKTYAPTEPVATFLNNGFAIYSGSAALTPSLTTMVVDNDVSHTIRPTDSNHFYWIQGGYFDYATRNIYLAALRLEHSTLRSVNFDVVRLPVNAAGVPDFAAANQAANQYSTGFLSASQKVGFPMQLVKMDDGYVYVYGWRDPVVHDNATKLIVGRFWGGGPMTPGGPNVPSDVNNRANWRFYRAGQGFANADYLLATSILPDGVTTGQWGSVTPTPAWNTPFDPNRRYMFVTAPVTPFSTEAVAVAFAPNPWGPFSNYTTLFAPMEVAPAVHGDPNAFTGDIWIAASAHPEYSLPGEAIITVNLHGDHDNATEQAPHFYRVRKL